MEKPWDIEDAIEAAKIVKEEMDEKFNSTSYKQYRRDYDSNIPSLSFITNRYRWSEFIKLMNGKPARTKSIDAEIKEFCDNCRHKENCNIELENCEYWREWNENKRKSFG